MNKELRIKNKKLTAISYKLKATGFTLVETLVAIAILMLAIIGPLTIASNSLNAAYYASDQVTAFYLAQEGIEYARFVRDYNFINQAAGGRSWDQDIKDACPTNILCRLDSPSAFVQGTALIALSNCGNVGGSYTNCIVQKDLNGVFRQINPSDPAASSLTPTNFYRTITVTPLPNGFEDQVVVNVYWTTGGNLKSPTNFHISENIFNWYSSIGTSATGTLPVLTVTMSGLAGAGTITSDDGSITNCSSTCSASINSGTQITLTAAAAPGYVFDTWTGAGCSGNGSCIFTLNADTSVVANFTHPKIALTVTKSSTGNVTTPDMKTINCGTGGIICSASFVSGTQVTLTATPTVLGYTFSKWTDSTCSSQGNPCKFNIIGAVNVTPAFIYTKP